MFRSLLFAVATLSFSSFGLQPCTAQEKAPGRPNVLVILSDDVGYSDIGSYGGEVETPNLDALAENGVKFTQFYNTARCCPTRASLLTGLYPHQAGMGHMLEDRGVDGYRGDLNKQCVTIAEVLRDSGYRTYATGKWHISRNSRPNGPQHNWPLQRGFDKYYGTIWGAASFFDPAIWRGNDVYSCENDPEYSPDEYYFTDAMSDNAVTFLQQHAQESPEKPFFLYAAYTAAHWPMHALEKDIAKYKGRFDPGYDKLREERVTRMKKLGLLKPEWKVSPTAKQWEDVEHREWELRCMEVYAAMLDSMDQGIGRIVAELKRQGQFDNTLILYMQDNGGCAEGVGRQSDQEPLGTFKPMKPDEIPAGIHPKQTRDGRPVRHGPEAMPGGPDTYIAYGEGWANVSNTPFREYKHWVHEGGIATPLIAHWPKGIAKSLRNKLVKDPAHLIDIMPTCVDVARTSYPAERNGEKIKPLQGVSLRPVLEGKSLRRADPIYWEHEGNRAMHEGKWKIVAKENQPWELYDMDVDRTEMNDLAKDMPERVRELAARWDAWAERSDVLPLGAWRKEPAGRKGKGRMDLKAGDVLSSGESPAVDDRALTISVEILRPDGDGVLVAHGGKAHGYALYVRNGIPAFDLRRAKKLITVAGTDALEDGSTTATVVLDEKGNVSLLINGQKVAAKRGAGKLDRNPGDGLSVAHDSGDTVGKYPGSFPYKGQLGGVRIETGARR